MSAMTGHDLPTAMRASDAERDAVIADLSQHFQAGRLTSEELDERTGQALTARTWGELTELQSDLPATRPGQQIPAVSSPRTRPSPRRAVPPVPTGLAVLVIAAAVLAISHSGWGLIWLLIPALIIARRTGCAVGSSGHDGHQN